MKPEQTLVLTDRVKGGYYIAGEIADTQNAPDHKPFDHEGVRAAHRGQA